MLTLLVVIVTDTNKWTIVACSGSIPCGRSRMRACVVGNRMFILGGLCVIVIVVVTVVVVVVFVCVCVLQMIIMGCRMGQKEAVG